MAVQLGTFTRRDWNLRARLREALLEPASPAYQATMRVIVALIILSVVTLVVESVGPLYGEYRVVIDSLETFIVAAFTAEFIANLYVAENKRRYLTSFWGVVDMLAIVPSYLSALHVIDVKAIRTLRVLRMLRVLKLMKLAAARAQESSVRAEMHRNTFGLDIQIYFIALFTAVTISSTLAYYAEHEVPETLFNSIPAAMWWAITTITTTGYGDMVPVTFGGRLIAAGTMLTGLALFGILTSVIGKAVLTSLFGSQAEDDGVPTETAPASAPSAGGAILGDGLPVTALSAAAVERVDPATATDSAVSMPLDAPARRPEARSSRLSRVVHTAFADQESRVYRVVSTLLMLAILSSVVLVIVESVESIATEYQTLFNVMEAILLTIFTVEYAANVYLASNKRRYIFSFWGGRGPAGDLAVLPGALQLHRSQGGANAAHPTYPAHPEAH
ncbi:MAG: ion transporter [Chloroflexota bacterium]